MDKLKMHSVNKVDENVAKIGKLFPNCLTERKNDKGEVEYAIDFDMLKQELSSVVVEGNEERYQFTWPDKKKSILLANAPISKTLRPCREESVDFDNTENLHIEGDNLDVLKLLQETYLGKIKMIYIDPPYNTGNDFVYNDDFAESTDEYLANSGQFDEEGNRLVQNTESNGRYHTDWLNMIYPRLKLAKDLLTDDGVIFISIDDNEIDNLIKSCLEVFGVNNVEKMVWKKNDFTDGVMKLTYRFRTEHEYIVACYKDVSKVFFNKVMQLSEVKHDYPNVDNDPRGNWISAEICRSEAKSRTDSPKYYGLKAPSGKVWYRQWLFTEKEMAELIADNRVYFGKNGDSLPRWKKFVNEERPKAATSILTEYGTARSAMAEMATLFNERAFDYPKPTKLICYLIKLLTTTDGIVLDFFSGSATTANAVMQLNAEDGGNRKFIMVQLPEETDEKSEAYKAGYKNICEIGKERIRRAGAKIKEDYKIGAGFEQLGMDSAHFADDIQKAGENAAKKLDTGFRVLKLDSTNMKDVYYNPAEYEMSFFDTLADNIKEDRTPEDLLFQVMLDLGVLLSSKIEESIISGKKVFNVADGFLYACFDSNITEDVISEIAKKEPYYFVMRDSSMANDSVATNFDQIFATYSPSTVRKVL